MAKCRVTSKNTNCGGTVTQESQGKSCPPVNVCLGFGRSLVWAQGCPEVRGRSTIEDGWYGQVQVINGCIVDARQAPVPVYTPAPCSPSPGPCDQPSSTSITLNPDACNLLTYVSGMLSAKLYFGDMDGVTVSGCGTENSPLRISVIPGDNTIYMRSGSPNAIGVTGDGSIAYPFTVSMTGVPIVAGWHGEFEIDAYGRVIGFDASRGGLITAVDDGDGIAVVVESGVLTVNLKDVPEQVAGQYTTGGYTYTINGKGQVTGVRRDITLAEGTYQFGSANVSVNAYGSITGVEPVPPSTTAIPDTFVAAFRGDATSVELEREMSIVTAFDGPLYIEYRGLLGSVVAYPGITMTLPEGFMISVDGIAVADPLIEVIGTPTSSSSNPIVAIRGTTINSIAAGPHVIVITAATPSITRRDGFMRVQTVGRGA